MQAVTELVWSQEAEDHMYHAGGITVDEIKLW
jgi:hypothetical protein